MFWKKKKSRKNTYKIAYSRGMLIRWPGSLMLKNSPAGLEEGMAAGMLPFLLLLAKLQFCRKI